MKTVITYGTFDLFHVGHVRLLCRLRALGDHLIVGCSTDEFNAAKGKQSAMSYEHREELLRSCRYVDDVFPEENWEQKQSDILKFHADIFAMGDDWSGRFDDLQAFCQVVYLPRTGGVSSTSLKELIVAHVKIEITSIISEVQGVERRLRNMTKE